MINVRKLIPVCLATGQSLLTNQPKLTLTLTLTLIDTVTVIFYAHFVDTHKKVVSHQ